MEGAVRIAGEHAQGGQRLHRVSVPGAVGHIGEGDRGGHILVIQKGVEHLSHLGPGHVSVRAEGAVGIAAEVGDVVAGIQPAANAVQILAGGKDSGDGVVLAYPLEGVIACYTHTLSVYQNICQLVALF